MSEHTMRMSQQSIRERVHRLHERVNGLGYFLEGGPDGFMLLDVDATLNDEPISLDDMEDYIGRLESGDGEKSVTSTNLDATHLSLQQLSRGRP
jgi:hypothetical protein